MTSVYFYQAIYHGLTTLITNAHCTMTIFLCLVTNTKKNTLYLAIVRSHLCYCSQVWRPRLIKDIVTRQQVQRSATKYILDDYVTDYKSKLSSHQILPLTFWIDLLDILFLVKCLKDEKDSIGILKFISFVDSITRSSTSKRLKYNLCRTPTARNFYFSHVVHLWKSIAWIDLDQSFPTIRCKLLAHMWVNFHNFFNVSNPCSLIYFCPCSMCFNSPRP